MIHEFYQGVILCEHSGYTDIRELLVAPIVFVAI